MCWTGPVGPRENASIRVSRILKLIIYSTKGDLRFAGGSFLRSLTPKFSLWDYELGVTQPSKELPRKATPRPEELPSKSNTVPWIFIISHFLNGYSMEQGLRLTFISVLWHTDRLVCQQQKRSFKEDILVWIYLRRNVSRKRVILYGIGGRRT